MTIGFPKELFLFSLSGIKKNSGVKIKFGYTESMSVNRFDLGELKSPSIMPQGYLKADSLATRAGVFTYLFKDGSMRRELRPAEEVFKNDSLASMKLIPVTNDHPPEQLNSENTKKYQAGYTSENVAQHMNNFMKVGVIVTDKSSIDDVMNGKTQLSAGYVCDLEMSSGIYDGEYYDAIQRNIIYNHLAIVDVGRAGPDAKIKLDDQNCFFNETVGYMVKKTERKDEVKENSSGREIKSVSTLKEIKKQGAIQMPKIKIDSVEWELTEAQAPLVQVMAAKLDSLKSTLEEVAALKSELDKSKGRNDGLEAEIKTLKEKKLTDKEMVELSKGRLDAIEFAKKVGAEFKEDADTIEIKKSAILKIHPETNFEGKSEDYIQGRFDSVINSHSSEGNKDLETSLKKVVTDSSNLSDSEKKRREYEQKRKDAWKSQTK